MALSQLVTHLEQAPQTAVAAAIRRCTYRRLGRIAEAPAAGYDVSCLYPDRRIALPIGDLDSSMDVCASCTASHIFRPDED